MFTVTFWTKTHRCAKQYRTKCSKDRAVLAATRDAHVMHVLVEESDGPAIFYFRRSDGSHWKRRDYLNGTDQERILSDLPRAWRINTDTHEGDRRDTGHF